VRDNLHQNVLSGNSSIKGASAAACLLVGKDDELSDIPSENVDHAYETLGRVIGSSGVVHRGIYAAKRPLSAYTLLTGLPLPKDRCDEIARIAGHADWADM